MKNKVSHLGVLDANAAQGSCLDIHPPPSVTFYTLIIVVTECLRDNGFFRKKGLMFWEMLKFFSWALRQGSRVHTIMNKQLFLYATPF